MNNFKGRLGFDYNFTVEEINPRRVYFDMQTFVNILYAKRNGTLNLGVEQEKFFLNALAKQFKIYKTKALPEIETDYSLLDLEYITENDIKDKQTKIWESDIITSRHMFNESFISHGLVTWLVDYYHYTHAEDVYTLIANFTRWLYYHDKKVNSYTYSVGKPFYYRLWLRWQWIKLKFSELLISGTENLLKIKKELYDESVEELRNIANLKAAGGLYSIGKVEDENIYYFHSAESINLNKRVIWAYFQELSNTIFLDLKLSYPDEPVFDIWLDIIKANNSVFLGKDKLVAEYYSITDSKIKPAKYQIPRLYTVSLNEYQFNKIIKTYQSLGLYKPFLEYTPDVALFEEWLLRKDNFTVPNSTRTELKLIIDELTKVKKDLEGIYERL